jgi:hypothetical protein
MPNTIRAVYPIGLTRPDDLRAFVAGKAENIVLDCCGRGEQSSGRRQEEGDSNRFHIQFIILNSAVGVEAGMQDLEMKRREGGAGLIHKVIRITRLNAFALKSIRAASNCGI